MKIFTLGNGFIANHIKYPKITDRLKPDIKQLSSIMEKYKPDILINCIGYCGSPNIDACETNKQKTIDTNITIPSILSNLCEYKGIKFIHLGSGCIFCGESKNINVSLKGPKDTGWKETDLANPKSFYSKTKYACDLTIGDMKHTCILRLRMPISDKSNPRNLINKLLGYSKVLECPNSITFIEDLVRAIDWVIDNNKSGIYNVASDIPITHSQILEEYKKYNSKHTYTKITENDLSKIVIAPRSNCILDVSKIKNEGFELLPTHSYLNECIKKFVENN